MDRSSALPHSIHHPLVERLAALLERGDSLQLRIAALEKAAALVAPSSRATIKHSSGPTTTAASLRRHKDDIAMSLVAEAALQVSVMDAPSRRVVAVKHNIHTTAATTTTPQRKSPPPPATDATRARSVDTNTISSASSSSSSSSRSASASSHADTEGRVNNDDTKGGAAAPTSSGGSGSHVTFLLNQMRDALSPHPHLAPPMPTSEYRTDVKEWLFGSTTTQDLPQVSTASAAEEHAAATPQPLQPQSRASGGLAPAPAPSGPPPPPPPPPPAGKKAPPPLPPPAKLAPPAPPLAEPTPPPHSPAPLPPPLPKAAPPPPVAAPPPKALPPPPAARPPPTPAPPQQQQQQQGRDWESEAKAAVADGTWKQVVDKQNRTYYFHVKEKKTCWNLAKELEKRSSSSSAA